MQAAQQGSAKNIAFQLFVALAVIGIVCALGPWWAVYEFNPDEGINLQKALLVSQGHHLYSEIWSDQPPFLTYVLAGVDRLFPFSIGAARATVLLFAAMLAVSLFRVVARFEGVIAGSISVVLLTSSSLFLELSVAVMIGLPAIALAMLSVDIATSGKARHRAILAGIVFALALLTKMFAFIVLPAVLAGLWFARKRNDKGSTRDAIVSIALLLIAAGSLTALVLVVQGLPLKQLIGTHLAASDSTEFDSFGGFKKLFKELRHGALIPHWFAILFGLAALWKRPASSLAIPVLWLAIGILVLGSHRPLWSHQVLILVPPLCWLGAAGFKSLFVPGERSGIANRVMGHSDYRVGLTAQALVLAVLVLLSARAMTDIHSVRKALNSDPSPMAAAAQTRLALFDGGSNELIADRPIDAFHRHLSVPPNLAVWSAKRVAVGGLSEAEILDAIRAHPESNVLLRRHDYSDDLLKSISELVPRVEVLADQYSGAETDFFAYGGPSSDLEGRLLAQLPAVMAGSLGGVAGPNPGERLARPQSKRLLPKRSVVARPPGSAQELGTCFLAASRITQGKRLFLEAAGVGRALACVQTRNGGWRDASSSAIGCSGGGGKAGAGGGETLDDGTIPSILYFSFDLSDRFAELSLKVPAWLKSMIDRALSFAIQSQSADGSWAQESVGDDGYHQLATLNDDTMTGMIRVLLVAYQRYHNPVFLDAARRGGEFLLRAQGEQAGFAQQYTLSLEIAPARKFEPAAFSSLETAYAINALIDLHLSTQDQRFLAGAEAAADWLTSNQITPDKWARFYEIGTNKPVYADRSGTVTYELNDLPVSEQNSYRWVGDREIFPEIGVALNRLENLRQSPEKLRDYDAQIAASSLLAATPTARLPLTNAVAALGAGDVQSTRKFAEYCAGLVGSMMQAGKPLGHGSKPG